MTTPTTGEVFDITPSYSGYSGPGTHFTWAWGAGVAWVDDPRTPIPWVLVPTSTLTQLTAAAHANGDHDLAAQAERLILSALETDHQEREGHLS